MTPPHSLPQLPMLRSGVVFLRGAIPKSTASRCTSLDQSTRRLKQVTQQTLLRDGVAAAASPGATSALPHCSRWRQHNAQQPQSESRRQPTSTACASAIRRRQQQHPASSAPAVPYEHSFSRKPAACCRALSCGAGHEGTHPLAPASWQPVHSLPAAGASGRIAPALPNDRHP